MILAGPRAGDGLRQLRLITQPDHAFFAAELLSLWRADGLPDHPRRADLLFATREHDNGWREADAAPSVDRASGQPQDFLELSAAERREIWHRGTRRYAEERPYAAALIVQHASRLLAAQTDTSLRELVNDLPRRREELLAESGRQEAELLADYSWLDLADAISLVACGATAKLPGLTGYRASTLGGPADLLHERLELEPFPLASATSFRIPCRLVPARRFAGSADLGGETASARWQELILTVQPSTSYLAANR